MSAPHFPFCTCNAWVNKTFTDWNITLRLRSRIIGKGGAIAGIRLRYHLGWGVPMSGEVSSHQTAGSQSMGVNREIGENWGDWRVNIAGSPDNWYFKFQDETDWFQAPLMPRNTLTPGHLMMGDELYKSGAVIHGIVRSKGSFNLSMRVSCC